MPEDLVGSCHTPKSHRDFFAFCNRTRWYRDCGTDYSKSPPGATEQGGFVRRRCRAVHFVRREGTPHRTRKVSVPAPTSRTAMARKTVSTRSLSEPACARRTKERDSAVVSSKWPSIERAWSKKQLGVKVVECLAHPREPAVVTQHQLPLQRVRRSRVTITSILCAACWRRN